jgi:cyclic beta-1,2-glucan synthetase
MYRAGIEWILGVRLRGTKLHLDPCIPQGWRRFEIILCYHSSRYEIVIENPNQVMRGVSSVEFDGVRLAAGSMFVELADDGATHRLRVILGAK